MRGKLVTEVGSSCKGRATSDGLGQVHHWAVVAKVQRLSHAQLDQLSGSCAETVGVFFFLFFFSLSACLEKEIAPKVLSERSIPPIFGERA